MMLEGRRGKSLISGAARRWVVRTEALSAKTFDLRLRVVSLSLHPRFTSRIGSPHLTAIIVCITQGSVHGWLPLVWADARRDPSPLVLVLVLPGREECFDMYTAFAFCKTTDDTRYHYGSAASRRTLHQAALVPRHKQRSLQILDGTSARLLSAATRYLLPLSNNSLALASPCIDRLCSTLDRGRLRSLGSPPRLVWMYLWPARSYMRTAHAQVCDTMRRDTTYPAPSPSPLRSRSNNRSTCAPVVSTKSRAATRSSGQRPSRLEIS
jgi:hypothetical protein